MIEIKVCAESFKDFAGQRDNCLMVIGQRLNIGDYVRLVNETTGSGLIVRIDSDSSGPMADALKVFSYRIEFLIKRG